MDSGDDYSIMPLDYIYLSLNSATTVQIFDARIYARSSTSSDLYLLYSLGTNSIYWVDHGTPTTMEEEHLFPSITKP